MDRRDFIHTSCVACAAGIGLSAFLQSCTTHKYISNYKVENGKISVKRSEFVLVKKGKTIEQKFIVVQRESPNFPIAVYQLPDNKFQALLLQCTHLGCELNPFDTALVCPCHGAEFDTKGDVTTGPANRSLTVFETSSDAENIYILLA